jgi:hypothetical protein
MKYIILLDDNDICKLHNVLMCELNLNNCLTTSFSRFSDLYNYFLLFDADLIMVNEEIYLLNKEYFNYINTLYPVIILGHNNNILPTINRLIDKTNIPIIKDKIKGTN